MEKTTPATKEKTVTPMIKRPFPKRMLKRKLDLQYGKFLEVVKNLHIIVSFTELLNQVPAYSKFF